MIICIHIANILIEYVDKNWTKIYEKNDLRREQKKYRAKWLDRIWY